jgi:hypothetical protein
MKFGIITPKEQNTTIVECASPEMATAVAGLSQRGVDHGMLMVGPHRVGIIVYEYSMFVPPAEQSYFAINGRLYGGNAVLYGVDDHGETIDLRAMPDVFFMPNQQAVERSIELGLVQRPYMAANDEIIWQWPAPRP